MMNYVYEREKLEAKNILYKEIQRNYNFTIPQYILSEIIKPLYDKKELCMLINMAIMNERFSDNEGKILKEKYCYK